MAKHSNHLLYCVLLLALFQIKTGEGATSNMSVTKLRIGVPKKDGFTQFIDVHWNPRENKYNVSGYCIDVFNAVVNALPFNVSPQFEPYVNKSGHSAGTYDSLIQQVPKMYDALVGDITIVANRSKFVDFTLPYTEEGVSMLVPVQHGRHLTMWIFVKPFSWDLWLSISVLSIFIGLVILIMERNVNSLAEDGSPRPKQLNVITILWFPLSQAVLPERQIVARNCSRFVLMVWLLLAIILLQSYTASLTTMLTVDQLQPSFLSVNDLKKKSCYVGYQTDSFVWDLLVQRLKFEPSKLRAYSSVSEYHNALRLGNHGGGVAAVFDGVPYLKVFLKQFGSDYMIAGPTYRTDGFGFAFPLNSNMTSHFSRAILNVTESDIMDQIEKRYFGTNEGTEDQSAQISSSSTPSLTAYSFAGLFLITGLAILIALIVSESVIWRKPITMARVYSKRYLFGTPRSNNKFHPTNESANTRDGTEDGS